MRYGGEWGVALCLLLLSLVQQEMTSMAEAEPNVAAATVAGVPSASDSHKQETMMQQKLTKQQLHEMTKQGRAEEKAKRLQEKAEAKAKMAAIKAARMAKKEARAQNIKEKKAMREAVKAKRAERQDQKNTNALSKKEMAKQKRMEREQKKKEWEQKKKEREEKKKEKEQKQKERQQKMKEREEKKKRQQGQGAASVGSFANLPATGAEILQKAEEKARLYQGMCNCVAYDGLHIVTFDRTPIHFRGGCEYTFARALHEFNDCSFEVSLQTALPEGSPFSHTTMVHILMFGFQFTIYREGWITIDNMLNFPPIFLPGRFYIVRNPESITFHSFCGLTVTVWKNFAVQVLVNPALEQKSGICGTCDAVDENGDVTSGGTVLSGDPDADLMLVQGFTASLFKMNLPLECQSATGTAILPARLQCTGDTSEELAECFDLLVDSSTSPFGACAQLHPAMMQRLVEMCVLSHCLHGDGFQSSSLRCTLLDRANEECWQRGVYVDGWADMLGCPQSCPTNSEFSSFVPSCAPTCTKPYQMKRTCSKDTHAGCGCQEGFVQGEEGCVSMATGCGCVYGSHYYVPPGKTILNSMCTREINCVVDPVTGFKELNVTYVGGCGKYGECIISQGLRQCECKEGYQKPEGMNYCYPIGLSAEQIERRKERRHQMQIRDKLKEVCDCRASGDPHYTTYDGQLIHFQGACTYILSRTQSANSSCAFDIKVENNRRNSNVGVSFTRAVYIEVGGDQIFLFPNELVMVNQLVRFPPIITPHYTIIKTGISVEVTTACGVSCSFDGVHRVKVMIPRDIAETGNLTGICGTCNGNKRDDISLRNGTSVVGEENRYTLIGNSYLTTDPVPYLNRPEEFKEELAGCLVQEPDFKCSKDNVSSIKTNAYCGGLIDDQGVFKDCVHHSKIGRTPFNTFSSCVMDVCAYFNQPQMVTQVICMAYENLAAVCDQWGIPITWRTATFCPLECPAKSTYQPRMSGCDKTCLTTTSQSMGPCTLPDTEGCECDSGYLKDNNNCILEEDCGCKNTDGNYVPRGEQFLNDNCTLILTCVATEFGSMLNMTEVDRTCSPHATCFRTDSHATNLICQCNFGYTGDGFTCDPIVDPGSSIITPGGFLQTGLGGIAGLSQLEDEDCVCKISGDPHLVTMDGGRLSLTEPCMYVFSEASGPTTDNVFRVEVKNQRIPRSLHPDSSYVRLFDVIVGQGQELTVRLLKRNQTQVKLVPSETFESVELPYTYGNVTVVRDGLWMNLTTTHGLHMAYDGRSTGYLTLTPEYRGHVTGLCGNCNGDRLDDLTFNGTSVRAFEDREEGSNELASFHLTEDTSDVPDTSEKCQPMP